MKLIIVCIVLLSILNINPVAAADAGKKLFEERCAACHSIGGGKIVGPDLSGVSERREEGWLIKWIRASQDLVKAGDPIAKQLLAEFIVPMPDQTLTDDEIKSVLTYIKEMSGTGKVAAEEKKPEATREATPEEISLGQSLFQGKVRFVNGGPACISCHSVDNVNLISGGVLARGLTTIYSRTGEPGVQAIIMNPPFPVMKAAFDGKAILDDEVRALIGFLKFVDKENTLHQPREYGWAMFGVGSVGVLVLLGLYSAVGHRRKRQSVNQAIYDRQIKSE